MKNKELLKKIYYENREINRNLQRLINIALIGILGKTARETKESDDQKGKFLVKTGLVFTVVSEGVLMIGDLLDYRKCRIE